MSMLMQGYSSGLRLLQATCKVFFELCNNHGLLVHMLRGFRMSYSTNIPRMVRSSYTFPSHRDLMSVEVRILILTMN